MVTSTQTLVQMPAFPDFRIGCSGWYYRHWHGPFYPAELPSHRWFKHHYSRHFNTVELNAPFYRWPKPETITRWYREAHRNFVYSIKVNALITHERRFAGTKRLIREFCSLGEILGPHMGAFLFQMPPSFRYSPSRLRQILDQLDPRWTNVLEFRHRDWWNDQALDAIRTASASTSGGITFCSTSGPRLPQTVVHTGLDVYVRFHGPKRWYRHDYNKNELAPWSESLVNSGARRVYAYFNNDRDAYAIKNARTLRRLVRTELLARGKGGCTAVTASLPLRANATPRDSLTGDHHGVSLFPVFVAGGSTPRAGDSRVKRLTR